LVGGRGGDEGGRFKFKGGELSLWWEELGGV
jgi:hypothetical protein